LYLTPLAFGAPTGGNAPCSNMHAIDNIKPLKDKETRQRVHRQYLLLQGKTMGMHKVRIVSLSPKSASIQDGIVEVHEGTDCSGITSVNKTVPFKILSL
ncbi:hypothetical protein T12_7430, partial [Trichinella patagoniensis]